MKFRSLKTLVLLLAVFSFFSCKKSSDTNYYVKLKINGNWVTWKTVIGELGPDLGDPTKTDFGVTANDDAMKDVFDISIQVDGSTFNTGSYDSDITTYQVLISYTKDATGASAKYFDIEDAGTGTPSRYLVSVSSITGTTLKGTFTGNYLFDFVSGESMNITDGEFYVRRAR